MPVIESVAAILSGGASTGVDAIVTALMIGLGASPSVLLATAPKSVNEPHVEVTRAEGP